jgi:hypothetical protein
MLSFGLLQFHGYGSWFVCEVALRHLQNHVVWSRILKCSVKSHATGHLNQMLLSMNFHLRKCSINNNNNNNNNNEHSECHGLLVLCQAYLEEVVYENSASDHET